MNSKEIIDKLLNGEMKLYQVDKFFRHGKGICKKH